MLQYGANFVDTVKEMQPWRVARAVVGATMDLGLGLMAFNFYKTAREGARLEAEAAEMRQSASQPIAMVSSKSWLENPSTVVEVAGIGFFSFAVILMGIMPWLRSMRSSCRLSLQIVQSADLKT
jgi:hypothetical protein